MSHSIRRKTNKQTNKTMQKRLKRKSFQWLAKLEEWIHYALREQLRPFTVYPKIVFCSPAKPSTIHINSPNGHGSPYLRLFSLTSEVNWSEVKWSEVAQSCPTLCNPMDCSLPGSSVHGILQARILEWVAISFSRGSSRPRDLPYCRQRLLPSEPPGKPLIRASA